MSSAVLQWVALATMVVDHVGYVFFPGVPLLRAVGRISFPIFAFLLAEGFTHTRDLKKYAARLAAFAVVAEAPYQLMIYGRLVPGPPVRNILFALLLSLGALWCARQGGLWLLGAAAAGAAAQAGGFSYGAYGVAIVVLFYLTQERRWLGMVCLCACTALYCWYHESLFQVWAVLAAVPLLCYNGRRGRRPPRYFFYIFYPAHLAVLVGLRFLQRWV